MHYEDYRNELQVKNSAGGYIVIPIIPSKPWLRARSSLTMKEYAFMSSPPKLGGEGKGDTHTDHVT